MILDELLDDMYRTCTRQVVSRREIVNKMQDVLEWLVGNNTHENCQKVDHFVSTKLVHKHQTKLPDDMYEILSDMGGTLHDTHSAPEIAQNFLSTPEQLLERTKKLLA